METTVTSLRNDRREARKTFLSGKAVFGAGLGAGIFFLLLEFVTGLLGAGTLLGPAHLTLREFLGVPAGPFSVDMVMLAVLLHFVLSLLTTAVLGLVIHRWRTDLAVPLGLVYGVLLYTMNFVVFAGWLPGLEAGRGIIMTVDYALYGAAAAWLYKRLQLARRAKGRHEK